MAQRNDAVISIVWLVVLIVLVVALLVGGFAVGSDFSAERGFRWLMAAMFLGGSFAWLTVYYRDSLRSFFNRPR